MLLDIHSNIYFYFCQDFNEGVPSKTKMTYNVLCTSGFTKLKLYRAFKIDPQKVENLCL